MKYPMPKKFATRVVIVVSVAFLIGIMVLFACRNKEMFESKPTLTYYFLPTCGWCTKFNPEWEKFVEMGHDTIVSQKVDGSKSPDVEKYNIKGFPHVQLVKGDKVIVFEGERTADNLMKFVKDNVPEPIVVKDNA